MKNKYALLIIAACIQPALSQVVVEETVVIPAPPAGEVVRETVIESTPDGDVVTETVVPLNPPPAYDPAFTRRHLLVEPRAVAAPVHPPGTVVETTETKNYVDVPGQPRRFYNVERNVVIVEGKELPYVTIPVLFEKETAKLLDVESRVSLEETAGAILEVLKTQPTAVFDIEGHTSTDGTDEFNLTLSGDRARRVHQELTQRYLVPSTALSAHGYGEMYPTFPEGTEEQMVQDRRVLVVRKQ
jgi:outer membrane protein OmpA-like peptidoglycan-associated protein